MMSKFEQRVEEKRKIRAIETKMISDGKITPLELAKINFCMSGVSLLEHKNPDGGFNLF